MVDRVKIEKEAREILDKFAKALEKVEREHEIESFVDRDKCEREEGEGENYDPDFKKRFLLNAKEHDPDFIIAETGSWK